MQCNTYSRKINSHIQGRCAHAMHRSYGGVLNYIRLGYVDTVVIAGGLRFTGEFLSSQIIRGRVLPNEVKTTGSP